ncbi:MAG TPA: Hpt domain-containing protein [Alphaproteobacteria bacterium]|jgi:HPt (histidine-containing phosphotransfer) domain-containing protein|nr:Hpt domain-containing protein [Alphaproteobacteria bacterium]
MQDDLPPAFDLAYIADQWGSSDDDIYRTVLGIFAEEGTKLCGDARDALAEDQRQALERTAHTMKSAAANVGALHLSRCARALEEAAGMGAPGDLAPLVARLETAWAAVSARIADGGPAVPELVHDG